MSIEQPADHRLSPRGEQIRRAANLLLESVESYERHGTRTVDKLDFDLRQMAQICIDVRVEIARGA